MGGMIAQELASLLLQHKKKPKKDAQPTTVSVNPNEPNTSSKPQPSSTENRVLSLTLAVTHAGGFYSVPQVSTAYLSYNMLLTGIKRCQPFGGY
jgi:hypothetical protein